MRGHTVVMNASATIKPNNPYNIKLVIGDYNDSKYDSAVFIEAGTFGNFLDLGEDLSICNGEATTLDSGFTNIIDYSYQWKKDNIIIAGQTNPTLEVTTTGIYDLTITNIGSGCELTDQIIVSDLNIINPPDLEECDNGALTVFDLTQNNITTLGLDPAKYSLSYYASLNDLNNNIAINSALLNNYTSANGTTIYGRVNNIISTNTCTQTINFQLTTTLVTATKPIDVEVCENTPLDIPDAVESQILNGLNPANYTVSYFPSLLDAQNDTNTIINPQQFNLPNNTNTFSIWAKLVNNLSNRCFDIVDFTVNVKPNPIVPDLNNVFACTNYTLQGISNGNYFTGPDGTGVQLNAGDVITNTTQIYIYTEENGCTAQTSFNITIVEEFNIETEYCGEFIVPQLDYGQFYTAPNGPNGTGQLLTAGTSFVTDTSIFYYSVFDTVQCTDIQFDIVVHPLPPVDALTDVTTCINYTLPNITNGNYFTEGNGLGTHIYNIDANTCADETSFEVTIIDTTQFQDITVCGNYTIPNLTVGNYFTQPNGQGAQFNIGDEITTSQTIYFYAQTNNGCADNLPINITVNPLPLVDTLADVLTCVDTPYTLPTLTNGAYFTETGGLGTTLNAGDIISSSQTLYIYNFDGTCPNETSFNIEVRPLPPLNSFTDIFSCTSYVLPVITNGKYYTEPNAQGIELLPGTTINSTQTVYVYNQYNDLTSCTNEAYFTIHIVGINVDKPADVLSCDSYTLPPLTVGNYFTESGGLGTQLNAGDVITNTQNLYVYADNGNRFFCSDEHEFTVQISATPQLPIFNNIESCDSYTLPTLSFPGNTFNYYRQPNKVDLIDPSEYTITTIGTQTIYAYASAIGNDDCSDETQFELTIHPLLDLVIEGGIICVDANTNQTTNPFLLRSGLDPTQFTVQWYFDNALVGTGENYAATKAGIYTVETIKLTPDIGTDCNYNPTQVEVKASIPQAKIHFLTGSFTAPANIRVDFINEGFGQYEYRLNNGSFQNSNLFHDLEYGTHTVYIRDISGICSSLIQIPFKVINYPRFFTPNNDAENETWNIPDLLKHPEAEIHIYNRYGKIITTIKPGDYGWDGTSKNGKKLPSTDYWFTVSFIYQGQPTNYSGNFSLIRKQ